MTEKELDEQFDNLRLELRRGVVVLAVLSQMDTARYGYSLIQRLGERGLDVEEGTLYPLLRRLEKQGLLESEWEMGEARPRKYYRISPLGRKVLAALTTEWNDTVEVMHLILYGEKMSELIERYVHQVGRYLPGKERSEIQAELRSQIQDQLEDRYEGAPAQADVAAVLKELGDPRRMAASYGGEQYLVGPNLYPIMMMVLRRGWVIVPPVAILVHVLAALLGDESGNFINLLLEAAAGAFQATFIFTGIAVIIFAILQHSGEDLDEITGNDKGFDPLALPEINDPAEVDRFEAIFGMAFGTFAVLVMLYFLRVGGLTLRFNLADPGEVIPVPVPWLVGLIAIVIAHVVLQLAALLRGRWNVSMWLLSTILDIVGPFALYFVLWLPLAERFYAAVPQLVGVPFVGRGPEVILVISLIMAVIEGITKLVKMVSHRPNAPASYNVKAN